MTTEENKNQLTVVLPFDSDQVTEEEKVEESKQLKAEENKEEETMQIDTTGPKMQE